MFPGRRRVMTDSLENEEDRIGTNRRTEQYYTPPHVWSGRTLPGVVSRGSIRSVNGNAPVKERSYDLGDGIALGYQKPSSRAGQPTGPSYTGKTVVSDADSTGRYSRSRESQYGFSTYGRPELSSQRTHGSSRPNTSQRRHISPESEEGSKDEYVHRHPSRQTRFNDAHNAYGDNRTSQNMFPGTTKPSYQNSRGVKNKYDSGSTTYRSNPRGLVGLVNLGNTCFMNSVIQCLSNTPPLVSFFLQGTWRNDVNSKSDTKGKVAMALGELFNRLWTPTIQGSCERPSDIKRLIGKINPRFAGFDQQDAQEALRILVDALHNDLNRVKRKVPYKELDDSPEQSDVDVSDEWWSYYCERNDSLVKDLFAGQLKSEVKCLSCGGISRCFDPFMDLSLPIPQSMQAMGRFSRNKVERGGVSLHNCLSSYIQPEKISASGYICKHCKKEATCEKYLSIFRCPNVLVLHLKRFTFSTFRRSKITTSVDFPLNEFDISPYISNSCKLEALFFCMAWMKFHRFFYLVSFAAPERNSLPTYNLVAVSNHMGTLNGGHYTA